ncbi:MAG: hypothetical protein JSR21_10070 [Proteobacteria bacterium]|nr:hypothetical protein [Pseudomonadota bacterium]
MPSTAKLLAWIETTGGNEVMAAYVGGASLSPPPSMKPRPPARALHSSVACAQRWVEREASALGLPVEWLAAPPAL